MAYHIQLGLVSLVRPLLPFRLSFPSFPVALFTCLTSLLLTAAIMVTINPRPPGGGGCCDCPSGTAERGVQDVQLHTMEILWVCKTSFLHTPASTDVCLTNVMLTGSQFQRAPLKLSLSQSEGRQKVWRAPYISAGVASGLVERHRAFRAPRALERTWRLIPCRAPSDPGVAREPQK